MGLSREYPLDESDSLGFLRQCPCLECLGVLQRIQTLEKGRLDHIVLRFGKYRYLHLRIDPVAKYQRRQAS